VNQKIEGKGTPGVSGVLQIRKGCLLTRYLGEEEGFGVSSSQVYEKGKGRSLTQITTGEKEASQLLEPSEILS